MGFNINGPDFNKPIIKEAQNMQNNGGGGNLGYFGRQQKERKKKQEDALDFFEKQESEEDILEVEPEISIKDKLKGFIKNIKKHDGDSKFFKLTKN